MSTFMKANLSSLMWVVFVFVCLGKHGSRSIWRWWKSRRGGPTSKIWGYQLPLPEEGKPRKTCRRLSDPWGVRGFLLVKILKSNFSGCFSTPLRRIETLSSFLCLWALPRLCVCLHECVKEYADQTRACAHAHAHTHPPQELLISTAS